MTEFKMNSSNLTKKFPLDGKYSGVISSLTELFRCLPDHQRRAVLPLFVLMLIGAFAELITIGALLPFLAVIASPDDSIVLDFLEPVLEFFHAQEPARAMYVLTALFACAAVVATSIRLLLLWSSQNFAFGAAYSLSINLYRKTLNESYIYHTTHTSSELIGAINKIQIVTTGIFIPLMQGITSFVISIFIVLGIIIIDPIIATSLGLTIMIIYIIISIIFRSNLKKNSIIISDSQEKRIKVLQEGLGGIRDIIIDQSQGIFVETYERAENSYRSARALNGFLTNAPRFVIEAAGMIMIALVAVTITQRPGGLVEAIPILGALALGAQRLLPLIQQAFGGWASTIGNRQVLLDLANLLKRPENYNPPSAPPLSFNSAISLHGVEFSYSNSRRLALHNVNIVIPKGARIGIIGKTGSGKSTLIDIVLGLLEPTAGEVRIDDIVLDSKNRAGWQRHITHVPQSIYLLDASIAENIAFGVRREDIDLDRIRYAAERANLREVIATLPEGYETQIGERGVQLSGGQRQRIGIARALYKKASVLILDEATSALDNETERTVMTSIEESYINMTILIISHRISTLNNCDFILQIKDGYVEIATKEG